MTEQDLAIAVKYAVDAWMRATPSDEWIINIENSASLSDELVKVINSKLSNDDAKIHLFRSKLLNIPYFHLRQVFESTDIPNTPEWFTPVPDVASTVAARAAALAIHGFLNMETVSYGAENDGALFVNLVPIPGEGKFAEKSQGSMRGHTDAVSFPFNGGFDANNKRIAPSPDLVTLVGLRNPDEVPTTIMALTDILQQLSPIDIAELKKDQYSLVAQATFKQGTKEILGRVHTAIDEPILKDSSLGTIVRYSHSSALPSEEGGVAKTASENFEAACNKVAIQIVIAPGDVLVVSNRFCLHGRGVVGSEVGGQARWLLRTYGLDTSTLDKSRRHLGNRATYVLYP